MLVETKIIYIDDDKHLLIINYATDYEIRSKEFGAHCSITPVNNKLEQI